MELPQDFIQRMKETLGEEATAFFSSYEKEKTYGLRLNPLKHEGSISSAHLPFTLSPVPWSEDGFFAKPDERPGKHALHEAGAYYIQEPSAMSVVSLLAPTPGEIICDFCAAPGGKSTAIAGRMAGDGLLVSNEIFSSRAKILSQNIERLGVTNCVVTNEPPEKMSLAFPEFFDKVLVDAPCSGEGMFRKDAQAVTEWSPSLVELCRKRQEMILDEADKILRPGGVLVYSTCTFAPEENENQIADFLKRHPNYILEDWRRFFPCDCGLSGGRNWSCTPASFPAENTLRLWPHLLHGEGHFAARLQKTEEPISREKNHQADRNSSRAKKKKSKKQSSVKSEDFDIFIEKTLHIHNDIGNVSHLFHTKPQMKAFGEELYALPASMKSLAGIKVLRAGLHLGTRKKNRFEPSHALAMALLPSEAVQVHLCDDDSVLSYLRGETLLCDTKLHSWTLVCYRGYSLGWGKASHGNLKNHYPKGLRIP